MTARRAMPVDTRPLYSSVPDALAPRLQRPSPPAPPGCSEHGHPVCQEVFMWSWLPPRAENRFSDWHVIRVPSISVISRKTLDVPPIPGTRTGSYSFHSKKLRKNCGIFGIGMREFNAPGLLPRRQTRAIAPGLTLRYGCNIFS